jgi:hypothetical protein
MEVPPAPPASNNEEDLGKLLNARMVSGPGRRMLGGSAGCEDRQTGGTIILL